MLRRAGLGCAFTILVALPGAAYASAVSVKVVEEYEDTPVLEEQLHYTALTGESNRLRVDQAPDGDGLIFTDTGVERIFEAEDGCEELGPQQVLCRPNTRVELLEMHIVLGDRADRALVLSTDLDAEPGGFLPLELYGGGGSDVLRTRVQSAQVFGGVGQDRISAMEGRPRDRANRVFCGRGRDRAFVDRTFSADRRNCERVASRPHS